MIDKLDMPPLIAKNVMMADTFYDHLEVQIADAENDLSADEALFVQFTIPSGENITIDSIGYHNPNLIVLYGRDSENKQCRVISHMNAVVLTCKATTTTEPERKSIGFVGKQGD